MKYKVTLNNRTYEVEVEEGEAMLVDEYEAYAPAAAARLPLLPFRQQSPPPLRLLPPLPRLLPQVRQ